LYSLHSFSRPAFQASAYTPHVRRDAIRWCDSHYTWNAEGILSNGRVLALLNLFTANDVNIGIITETEIPSSSHGDFNLEGYHSFLPLSHSELLETAKYRVVVVVRSALATVAKIRIDLMHSTVQCLSGSKLI
jgi:hypothetical protein